MTGRMQLSHVHADVLNSNHFCRRYLSNAEKVGLLVPSDEKFSGIETEIEATDKFGLSGKGKAISGF